MTDEIYKEDIKLDEIKPARECMISDGTNAKPNAGIVTLKNVETKDREA